MVSWEVLEICGGAEVGMGVGLRMSSPSVDGRQSQRCQFVTCYDLVLIPQAGVVTCCDAQGHTFPGPPSPGHHSSPGRGLAPSSPLHIGADGGAKGPATYSAVPIMDA